MGGGGFDPGTAQPFVLIFLCGVPSFAEYVVYCAESSISFGSVWWYRRVMVCDVCFCRCVPSVCFGRCRILFCVYWQCAEFVF